MRKGHNCLTQSCEISLLTFWWPESPLRWEWRSFWPKACNFLVHFNRTPGGSLSAWLSHFSCVRLFMTPWTIAHQAPLSTGFSRWEYWSGLPCPSPGDLPHSGIKPIISFHWQVGSLPPAPPGKPGRSLSLWKNQDDLAFLSDGSGRKGSRTNWILTALYPRFVGSDMQENGEKLVSFLGHETNRRGPTALGELVPKLLSMGVNIVLTVKLLCSFIGASLVAQW